MNLKVRKTVAGISAVLALAGATTLTGCKSKADRASSNLSKEADAFHILRRIVFYNGITGKYMLVIEGYCSIGNEDKAGELSVTCKNGNEYKKHFLGLSDNVTYFAQQITGANVSDKHYKVYWNPETVIPEPFTN